MKKILLSVSMIAITAVIAVGATGAFLSDTEVSAGNTFTAGAIDLEVDNESYYNRNVCSGNSESGFFWSGPQGYPVPGTPCTTSWALDDLDKGLLFFDFNDLKPDDEGEDTISLHVNNNDAYMCMDMTLTSNNGNSSSEPELNTGDAPEDGNNTWDGELAGLLKMIWWVDDGDNVLEEGENLLNGGVQSLTDLFGEDKTFSTDLADATTNVWTPNTPGPVIGGRDYYIAKAWCYGTMAEARVAQDGNGKTGSNGPMVRGTGITCNGTSLGNESQTDGATLDVAFRVVQSRNNPGYTCREEQPRTAKLTVIKKVINDNGGNNIVTDFQLSVDNGVITTPMTSGATTTLSIGNYVVAETGLSGYVASFSGDCNSSGQVTLNPGDEKTCTLTNNDQEAHITLVKSLSSGTAPLTGFGLRIDGGLVNHNSSVTVNSNTPHLIDEDGRPGYQFVSITGSGCPASTSTPIVLNEGESITCTITNALVN